MDSASPMTLAARYDSAGERGGVTREGGRRNEVRRPMISSTRWPPREIEIVGENRVQDLARKHERYADTFPLALHRPTSVTQGARGLGACRARSLALVDIGSPQTHRACPSSGQCRGARPRKPASSVETLPCIRRRGQRPRRRCGRSLSDAAAGGRKPEDSRPYFRRLAELAARLESV